MTTSDKLREFCENWRSDLIKHGGIPEMLSDLTALISEGYYPKEFTRWFRSEKFYDIFEESTDGEDNTQWEYLPSGQILNTTDELFNYWKENEQC
mgnify:CR=1 FL=1